MRFRVIFIGLIFFFVFMISRASVSLSETSSKQNELIIYNWEDYFAPDTIKDFEKRFKVKVKVITFSEEEEMIASLQAHPYEYDLIIASGYKVKELIEMRLISSIDFTLIPNFKNIDPKFKNQLFDRQQRYSVPYLWGTTGLIYNKKYVDGSSNSWDILWNSKYKGAIAMLDNVDEVLAVGLKLKGYNASTSDSNQISLAGQLIQEQVALSAVYKDPIDIREGLINSKIWAAQLYSGDALFAISQNKDLKYILPKEGFLIWNDCFVISRDASNPELAHKFINYILEPQVGAKIIEYLRYASPNLLATELALKNDPSLSQLYLNSEEMARAEVFALIGEPAEQGYSRQARNKAWIKIQEAMDKQ